MIGTELKAFKEQINLALLDDIISFVVRTSETTRPQKDQLAQRCMFPIKATSANLFQERYGFLYLGELLERYEAQFGMSAPDRRAIALALGYTKDIATREMFVGSQRANFIQAVERAAQGDVYLTGALYLLNEGETDGPTYGKQLTEWQYAKTEELVFAMSLFDDTEQAVTQFKAQLILLLGPNRTMPVLENAQIYRWLVTKLLPLKKRLKAKDFTMIRALLTLPTSFIRPDSKPHDCLISYGYQPLEIAYANMMAVFDRWLDNGLHPHGLSAEKIAVNLFRTVLSQEDPLPAAVYSQLSELYVKYANFEVKYLETHRLADALGSDVRIKNAETMAWFIRHESPFHPATRSFDVLDAKWDTLPTSLASDQYLRLFENDLSSEMSGAELKDRIGRYDALTQRSYLDSYRKCRDGRYFPLLVNKNLIDLWTEFQAGIAGKDAVSLDMLYYVGHYVKDIKTPQAFRFMQKFMLQYGYAGLKRFFGDYCSGFKDGFDGQLWHLDTYSGGKVSLALERDFLENDPAGRLLLLHWADEYFFTVQPAHYLSFIYAVLDNNYAAGLLPQEDLRKLFDLLLTQGKLSVHEADRLKHRYFTPEEMQADQEARDAEELAAKRQAHDEELASIRDKYHRMTDSTFRSVWNFVNEYHYYKPRQAIADQIARDGIDSQLKQADGVLAKTDAVYLLYLCGKLLEHDAIGWAEAQAHISKIKEVLDDAPGNDTDG